MNSKISLAAVVKLCQHYINKWNCTLTHKTAYHWAHFQWNLNKEITWDMTDTFLMGFAFA